jgi:Ca2+-binding EF-hand superfamily protein
MERIFEYMDE